MYIVVLIYYCTHIESPAVRVSAHTVLLYLLKNVMLDTTCTTITFVSNRMHAHDTDMGWIMYAYLIFVRT